jgi:hypothetical protein
MGDTTYPVKPENSYKRTPEVIQKLEQAAAIDASIDETCFFAGISVQCYYNWLAGDPELKEKLERLRLTPVLKAKNTIAKNCDQVETAKWLLERKRPKEYGKAALLEDPADRPVYTVTLYPCDRQKLVPSPEAEAMLSEKYGAANSPNSLDLPSP